MCSFNQQEIELVQMVLEKFLSTKEPFTGRNVAMKCGITTSESRNVSSYVRELYNNGHFPAHWAAMKINGNDGPLLYFYVRKGTVARNVVEEIEINLKK